MSSEPLREAAEHAAELLEREPKRNAAVIVALELRAAHCVRSEEPRPRSEGTKSWHDGMTLVTHPDGTRCWHREPQWVEAGSPRSDAVLDRAIPHRTDDQPCACDECLGYLCEDNGVAFDRLPALDRERLRRQVPDDRLDAACEWVAPNPLNEYAVTYCETHDRPADQCAALPSPRSDDRRVDMFATTLQETGRLTVHPGDEQAAFAALRALGIDTFEVAAPRSDDREGTLREAGCHYHGEACRANRADCPPEAHCWSCGEPFTSALHSAPDTVDEPARDG